MATVVFPNSNLPVASQPWGRTVEKQLVDISLLVNSNEVNNAARDKQLLTSLNRTNAVAISAQNAATAAAAAAALAQSSANTANSALAEIGAVKTNIYKPGTTQINPTSISSGTITGITIKTSNLTSVARTEFNENNIKFFGTGGTYSGGFTGSTKNGYNVIDVDTAGFNVAGPIYALGNFYVSGTSQFTGAMELNGGLNLYGTSGILSTGSISTDGGLTRTVYSGGGTTGASFNNNGTLIRTSSSARYKQDISSLDFSYEDVLALEPKKFRLKDEAADDNDARYYAGFVAEELADTPLDIFVGYQKLEDGTQRPDSVYYAELSTALLSAIKHQDVIIKNLTNRLEVLENK